VAESYRRSVVPVLLAEALAARDQQRRGGAKQKILKIAAS